MSFELIVAGGFVLVVLALLAGGFILAGKTGRQREKLENLKEDARDATNQVTRRTDPVLSDTEYVGRLRRAKERLARLRDRATKR